MRFLVRQDGAPFGRGRVATAMVDKRVGSLVKIGMKGETFWVKIISKEKTPRTIKYVAELRNDLVMYRKKYGDRIEFSGRNILN